VQRDFAGLVLGVHVRTIGAQPFDHPEVALGRSDVQRSRAGRILTFRQTARRIHIGFVLHQHFGHRLETVERGVMQRGPARGATRVHVRFVFEQRRYHQLVSVCGRQMQRRGRVLLATDGGFIGQQ
jgi:hypothetical protein